MAKRMRTSALELSVFSEVRAYKLLVRVAQSVHKSFLPAFAFDSPEFARIEEYYGPIFMMHIVPEKYGFQQNVLRTKGCVQVRYTDFSPFGITKELLRFALTFWQDRGAVLKRRKGAVQDAAFKQLSGFQDCFLAMPIPGFEPIVSEALDALRAQRQVLILLEPDGTLFYRSSEELPSTPTKPLDWDFFSGAKCYYLRPGVKQFLRRLTSHPRVTFCFYSSMSELRCSQVIPLLSEHSYCFSAKYCGREEGRPKLLTRIWSSAFAIAQGFGAHNTILVESDFGRCQCVKKGLVLMPPYDLHQLQHCPSKLPLQHLYEYLEDVLDHSNYDCGAYMSAHPFTSYS